MLEQPIEPPYYQQDADLKAWVRIPINRGYLRANGCHAGAKQASAELNREVDSEQIESAWFAVVQQEQDEIDARLERTPGRGDAEVSG